LESSVAGWRSVNLSFLLNHKNGDFSILMRDILLCKSLGAGLCRNAGPCLAPALHGSLISAQPCSSALPYTLIYSSVTLSAA
jgi:hypothetical protein